MSRMAGVVFRHEAEVLNVSTPGKRQHVIGHLTVTAQFGHDQFTWRPEGDVPALGSTVWMEVAQ